MAGVVDFRGYIPLPQCVEGMTAPPQGSMRYVERYNLSSDRIVERTPEELVRYLDYCGVDHMVLVGRQATSEEISEYVSSQPGRLSGVASVSPIGNVMGAAREVRRSHDLGLRMVGLGPFRDGIPASDRKYYPIYAACAELGMAIIVHTSFNFRRGSSLELAHPRNLDSVAMDFPDLPIVASHGGWPWLSDMVAVALHNENIYIELSAHRAKHMARSGSGWEILFNYGTGPLRSRLLWGSTSPALDLKLQLDETRELPLGREVLIDMLDKNPRRLLGLIGAETGRRRPLRKHSN